MNKLKFGAVGVIALLIGWFVLTPYGKRTEPIVNWWTWMTTSTPSPATPTPAKQAEVTDPFSRPTAIPHSPRTVGAMRNGEIGYTYTAAVVAFGDHRFYLDPSASIKYASTDEYPILVERKADGLHVTGRKYKTGWRKFNQDVAVSLDLVPVTQMN